MKKFFLFGLLVLAGTVSFAQSLWNPIPETSISLVGERRIVPQKYQTMWLNLSVLEPLLVSAPERFTPAAAAVANLPILLLPNPAGRLQRYRLTESPVMAPGLQAQYPETRCYTGYGIDDPTAFLKCDLTPWGFHAMVLSSAQGTFFIDPYSHGDRENYVVYFRKDYQRRAGVTFTCETPGDEAPEDVKPAAIPDQGSCTLKKYRLALACTGEYAAVFGSTRSGALAAMNTSMNRVNGVEESEVAVTMQIIANDSLLVYLNASTDPYTNNNGNTMLGQNQTTCTNVIGSANYDIGHVFSTGGGGVASLSSVCSSTSKAQGVTGSSSPVGDSYDIDYVIHEMGHQFGGQHTFNGTGGSCSGNVSGSSAMEPGSGSTIMAYAGICTGQNVQSNSDAYFHARSLQQIGNFTIGTGNTCALVTNSSNNPPTVNGGADYTIPKSTPFTLTASGSDPDGNNITYNWEETDATSSTQPPVSTNTGGPTFRSFFGTASASRTFPELSAIVNNTTPTWEVLPSVARALNFRVTVRDIAGAYGCTGEDNVLVTVNAAGPFVVTSPNTAGVIWGINSTQTVTWNVAGTTASPISATNVNILLSTDGGFSYPTTLKANTPNDGTEAVTVPNLIANSCRIRIEAVGNIFFDISNANFTIAVVLPVELTAFQARLENQNTALLNWTTASETDNRGFDIEMKNEATAVFQTVGFQSGKGTTKQLSNYQFRVNNLTEGTWDFRLKQTDTDGKISYSPIRNVVVRDRFSVKLFPNPVQNDLNLVLYQETEGLVSFEVVNQLGQRFELLPSQLLDKGFHNLQVTTTSLPVGIYRYICRMEGGLLQGSIVVER